MPAFPSFSSIFRFLPFAPSEGEHPVSAKFRGLRNRFVRWQVLRAPHEQPVFTSVFEKMCFFQVQFAFQLRFSYVSAHLRFLFIFLFFGLKMSAFLKVKLLVEPNFFVFQLRFGWQKQGAHPLFHIPVHFLSFVSYSRSFQSSRQLTVQFQFRFLPRPHFSGCITFAFCLGG